MAGSKQMIITPEKFKSGDKFLLLGGIGGVWTLVGFGNTGDLELASPHVEGSALCYNQDQPNFIPIPEGATETQIEALKAIYRDER